MTLQRLIKANAKLVCQVALAKTGGGKGAPREPAPPQPRVDVAQSGPDARGAGQGLRFLELFVQRGSPGALQASVVAPTC